MNKGFIAKRKRIGPSDYMSCLLFIEKNEELKGNSNSDKKREMKFGLKVKEDYQSNN